VKGSNPFNFQLRNFVVYKSSAGSGKTFTLVKAYLRLTLADTAQPPVLFRQVLALTFTNKAAAEMKERVIKTLQLLSVAGNREKMSELLSAELEISPGELTLRAKTLLNNILHNYSEFSISTIDSFVHRIIRTFAIDLKLPLNFNIETNRDKILAACVDELAAKAGEDKMITDVLTEFSKARVGENKSWNIDKELIGFVKKILDESGVLQMEKLKDLGVEDFIRIKKKLSEFIFSFQDQLKGLAAEVISLQEKNNLQPADFYNSNKGIWNYFRKVNNGDFSDEIVNSIVRKTVEEDKWKSGSSALTDADIGFHKRKFGEIETKRSAGFKKYAAWKALHKNIYSLIVINEIEKLLAKYKDEENVVFISEFNRKISEVVTNEPVPFIYERIGERYRHFLLDEFQDTSVLQWQNLLPLVDNSLAGGNFNLLVGDGKQSIYRWRGGEVEQFSELPAVFGGKTELVAEREDALRRNYDERVLATNFRSRKKIVEFNNNLYSWLAENVIPPKFKKVYQDVKQEAKDENAGGYVSFELVNRGSSSAETDLAVCQKTLEHIRKNTNEFGYALSDIAVLVRTKRDANKIAGHLVEAGVPIVSSESLLIASNESVAALVAVLKLVSEPRSPVNEILLLRYLCKNGFFGEEKFSVTWQRFSDSKKNLGEWLFAEKIADIRRYKLSSLPLYDLCSGIARELKLHKKDPLFVRFFLDEVLNYSKSNPGNLKAFLDWWQESRQSCSAVLPGGTNAVSIMTIHTSKGLEFPVVILPFADWENKKADSVWIQLEETELPELSAAMISSTSHLSGTAYEAYAEEEIAKQVLDNVNLLYVATTRPINHLHIISRNRARSNYVDSWLSNFFRSELKMDESQLEVSTGEMIFCATGALKNSVAPVNSLLLRDWKEIVRIKFQEDDFPEISVLSEKREAGVLFHLAMSRIFARGQESDACEWLEQNGYCNAEEADRIQRKISSLFTNPQFADFFSPENKSRNEPEILLENGRTIRPDRVVFLEKETLIIDYKTGSENEKFEEQLALYESGMKLLGYTSVKKYIVYVEDEIIGELV
jgi:ATP-dependent exoDNAse (exonuclease V) beta subunit